MESTDNFEREDLHLLANDENAELPEHETWAGVHNSQVKGSAVIMYSMGNCPMMMVFTASLVSRVEPIPRERRGGFAY